MGFEDKWSNIIFFKTGYQVKTGKIDKLIIHIKYPRSDFRQKIQLIDSEPAPIERKFVNRGSYELYTYELDPFQDEMEIITRFSIEITEKRYPISRSPFPTIIDKESLKYYLQPTSLVECNELEIKEIGENLTALSKLLVNAVLRCVRWINAYLSYDPDYLEKRQSALETLQTKRGSCEDINHLFNAICRSINIPARVAMGVSKGASNWERHVWSEVFDPQFGWFPVDVLYKPVQMGQLGVSHIKRMTALDCNEPEFRVEYEYNINDSIPILSVTHKLFIDRSIVPVTVEINPNV